MLTLQVAEIERAYRKQHLFQNAKSKGASLVEDLEVELCADASLSRVLSTFSSPRVLPLPSPPAKISCSSRLLLLLPLFFIWLEFVVLSGSKLFRHSMTFPSVDLSSICSLRSSNRRQEDCHQD